MDNTSFDYIIVGAGSAGCVLANRLSENGKYSVCLLEAGPKDNTPFIKIPAGFAYFMFSKKYNWGFDAKVDSTIRNGQPLFVPRGKTLGGSSAINAMLYIRGQREDYDQWADLGNTGWSFDELLPYFKKSESNSRGDSEFHGGQGPLVVSDRPVHYNISKSFIEASAQAGLPLTDDFNGASQEGAGYYQCTIKDGQRCGVNRAYLKPALARTNITVIVEAAVNRVLTTDKVATGVEFVKRGKVITLNANKEVILSGGAINSPQLLLLSGIGDQAQLQQHNIELSHHLPGVGHNLQEHADACILVKSKNHQGLTASLSGIMRMVPDTLKYFSNKTGKLANSVVEAGAFFKSREDLSRPDIQLHMLPTLYDDSGRDIKLMRSEGYSCHVCVLRPKSTGSVSLKSSDPRTAPEIDFNLFSHPDDQQVMVDGLRLVRKILAAPAFDVYRGEEIHPGIGAQTDEQLFDKAKERLGTVFHPVGTCKMGIDDMAVVCPELKVHGIKKLRVVDASIMPRLISGNTNAPTIAIAEKAAEMILSTADND